MKYTIPMARIGGAAISASLLRRPSRKARRAQMLLAGAVLISGVAWFQPQAFAKEAYSHAQEPIGAVRQLYDGTLPPDLVASSLRNIDRIFPTRTVEPAEKPRPFEKAAKQLEQVKFEYQGKKYDLADYLALNRISGMMVLKDGKVAYETYQLGNDERTLWTAMSVTKSIASTLIGVAIKDGLIASVDDPVVKYVPRLKGTAYDGVSVKDVLMMSSGVKWNETYTDPNSDRRHFLEAQLSQKPGATLEVMAGLSRAAEPGSKNNYSTGETQIVGEILNGAIKRPIADYLSEKIWKPYGMEAPGKWWLDSPNGHEISGTGFAISLRDFARFGQFFLDNGVINGKSILPDGWVKDASTPKTLKGGSKLDYGYLWWIGRTEQSRADNAYYAVGIFGQFIYIDPKERIIVVQTAAEPKPVGKNAISPEVFFNAVVNELK